MTYPYPHPFGPQIGGLCPHSLPHGLCQECRAVPETDPRLDTVLERLDTLHGLCTDSFDGVEVRKVNGGGWLVRWWKNRSSAGDYSYACQGQTVSDVGERAFNDAEACMEFVCEKTGLKR